MRQRDRKSISNVVKRFGAVLSLSALFGFAAALAVLGIQQGPTQLARPRAEAVVLAVEDEIYDFGYEKDFEMVGPEVSPGITRVPAYITPALQDGAGHVIYKLMPYGEVYRRFYFNKKGLAVLEGAADSGFRPTEPNLLTLYLGNL